MKTSDVLILCQQARNLFMALRGGAAMATFRQSCEQKKFILNFLSDSNMDFVEIQKKIKDVHDFIINNNIEAPAINKLFDYLWEIYEYAEYFAKLWYENVDDNSPFAYKDARCWSSSNAIIGYIDESAEMKGVVRGKKQQYKEGGTKAKDMSNQTLLLELGKHFSIKGNKQIPTKKLHSFLIKHKVISQDLEEKEFTARIIKCQWKDLYEKSESRVKFRVFLVALKDSFFNEDYYDEISNQLGMKKTGITKHKRPDFETELSEIL